jgi:predicted Rossmann fold nucleotide-binding protein DprA/Smf involved in DNA uptake
MKIAIVGSRDFHDPQAVTDFVASLPSDAVIVSGGARGVDTWAERAALARGLSVEVHKANWDAYGKRAGFVRNFLIVKSADRVVAFWDGRSKGTAHSIRVAREIGKDVQVLY